MLNKVETELVRIFSENLVDMYQLELVEESGINTDFSVLGINSVEFMRLMVAIENELDIEFTDEHMDNAFRLDSLKDLAALIDTEYEILSDLS